MPRKTAKLTVFYIIGLTAASFLGSFAGVYIGAAIFLCGVLTAIFSKKYYSAKLFLAAFGIGFTLWSSYFGINYDSAMLFDGRTAEVSGKITALNELSGGRAIYTVDGIIDGVTPAKVSAFISENQNTANLGDSVVIVGELRKLDNSYTFASEDINKSKGIYLQFKSVKSLSVTAENNDFFSEITGFVKKRVYKASEKFLNAQNSELFKAMLFGDRTGISDTEKITFARAGVSHIMAVSGAQLSIICSYAVIVMEMLRVGRFKRFGVCLLLIAFFLMICEDSVSITRAAIMIIITFAVPLLNRQSDTATSLAISVIILTVENPLIIGDASFLLSVGGVLAVAVISPPVISRLKTDFSGFFGKFYMQIRDIFISSLIVSLTLFPISFLFFNEISLLSPFTNILLIPISTLVIILGMFIVITGAFSPLAALLFPTISLLCKLTALISEFAASLPFASIPTGYDFERPLIVIFIAAALFIGIFSKNGKKLKITLTVLFASFAVFICAVSLYRIIPSERLYAAVLGDERGASVVIHDKSNAIVIDLKGSGEAAPAVYKYLSSIGIEDISAVITRSGAVRAIPAYMEHLPSLYYPVKLFAAPKSLQLPESVVFPNDSGIFYEDNGGFIEYENIHTEFYENSVIITLNGDYRVIISDSEEITLPPDFDKPPDAIIYINGKLFTKQGNEEIIAALDSSAAVSADTKTEVFIGKSIRLDDKGNVKIIY